MSVLAVPPAVTAGGALAVVALGSNLGDSRAILEAAVERLQAWASARQARWVGLSALWKTAPWEAQGPDFLNAIAVLEGTLEPEGLLDALLAVERDLGRERPYRNAPRTLDLDLIVVEGQQRATPHLQLPHPRMWERAFVMRPLLSLLDVDLAAEPAMLGLSWLPSQHPLWLSWHAQAAECLPVGDWPARSMDGARRARLRETLAQAWSWTGRG